MACGDTTHPWRDCPYRLEGIDQQENAPPKEIKFRLDFQKLLKLDLATALGIVQMSVTGGNLKYQSLKYQRHWVDTLNINEEK